MNNMVQSIAQRKKIISDRIESLNRRWVAVNKSPGLVSDPGIYLFRLHHLLKRLELEEFSYNTMEQTIIINNLLNFNVGCMN